MILVLVIDAAGHAALRILGRCNGLPRVGLAPALPASGVVAAVYAGFFVLPGSRPGKPSCRSSRR